MQGPGDGWPANAGNLHLRSIIDAVPALISYIDATFHYRLVNSAYQRWFGPSPDEIIGQHVRDVLGESAWQAVEPHMARALAGEHVTYEQELKYRDGVARWVHVTYTPDVDATGVVRGFVALVNDNTHHKRIEDALRQGEQRLRLAQQGGRIGTFEWDFETDRHTWSDELLALHGLEPGEFNGSHPSWVGRVHPEDRPGVEAEVRRAFESGELSRDFRVVWPDGIVRWLHARAVVVFDSTGRPLRMIGVHVDITERKLAEEALRDADRRKDDFLATLAHELRNPLAPIRTAAEVLGLEGPTEADLDSARQMIERNVRQMVRLIDDLLDVSRITRNKLQLRRERIELAAAVHSAIEITRPLIDEMRHTLEVSLPESPVRLDADSTRLSQVLANLLNNAAKYTDGGGSIAIEAKVVGSEVFIGVRDSGIGITREHLPRIFEMFSQEAPALERSHGGLGIGLSLVKGIVGMHGGSVEAHSAGLGMGSEFIVRLPLTGVVACETNACRPAEPTSTAKRRVLVVDDNHDAAKSLGLLLNLMGHEIQTAEDGEAAVCAAESFRPDVALLDIGLPKLNGYEVAQQIRQQPWGKAMKLVALTGWGQEDDKRRAREAGFDHHLVKPVEPHVLQDLLAP